LQFYASRDDESDSIQFNSIVQIQKDPVMRLTQSESLWINRQFDLMDEALRSVTIGDEIMNEFIMYSLDVPLSKRFIS
jgi:hypothetical protein